MLTFQAMKKCIRNIKKKVKETVLAFHFETELRHSALITLYIEIEDRPVCTLFTGRVLGDVVTRHPYSRCSKHPERQASSLGSLPRSLLDCLSAKQRKKQATLKKNDINQVSQLLLANK